jgi:hypothetical protein
MYPTNGGAETKTRYYLTFFSKRIISNLMSCPAHTIARKRIPNIHEF